MPSERRILDADDLRRALVRMAHEIVEGHGGTEDLVLIGLRTRGHPLAERLANLIEEHEQIAPAGRLAGHHVLPRRPDPARPRPDRQAPATWVPTSRTGRWSWSTTCSTPGARSAPRSTR